MGRKRRERRMDDDGFYSGTDESTEARFHGHEVPEKGVSDRKESKWDYKISKTDAKTQKSYATAAKRNSLANLIKWVLIALGVFYGISKFGGGDLLEKAKGLFGQ